jgi:hypothetical protein
LVCVGPLRVSVLYIWPLYNITMFAVNDIRSYKKSAHNITQDMHLIRIYSVHLIVCVAYIERNATEMIAYPWPRRPGSCLVLRALEYWDRGFESQSGHGCVHRLSLFLQSCVGRGIAVGRSPAQGALPNVHKVVSKVHLNWIKPEDRTASVV